MSRALVLAAPVLVALALAGCAPASPAQSSGTSTVTPALPAPATAPTETTEPSATAPAPPSPAPEPEPAGPPDVRFLAVGDVLLSRGVAEAIREADDPRLPFRAMADHFRAVDFTFANLEFPFSKETLVPVRGNIFNAPQAWAEGLVEHDFRVLNLANNHAMDQGERGLFDTIALCAELQLICFGAGKNERQAWEPGVVEVDGIRIGFVGASYSSVNDSGKIWKRFVARIESKHRLKAAIETMKQDGVDYVVATMHAGIEYVPKPFGPQEIFAEAALRFGADIVIGAHPHVVQPAVKMAGRWVFYSLGNFIFDQSEPHTDEGAALDITLTRQGEGVVLRRLEVVPVVIDNATPRPARGARAEGILARMKIDDPLLVSDGEAPSDEP